MWIDEITLQVFVLICTIIGPPAIVVILTMWLIFKNRSTQEGEHKPEQSEKPSQKVDTLV